jgi:hypothetical protein
LHGLFLIGERLLARPVGAAAAALKLTAVPRLATALRVLITFHLVTFSWIFFRATAVTDAFYVAGHLFDNLIKDAGAGLSLFADGDLALAALLIATLMTVQFLRRATGALAWLRARPTWVRWCVYAALILAIINLRPEYDTGFIYLQF